MRAFRLVWQMKKNWQKILIAVGIFILLLLIFWRVLFFIDFKTEEEIDFGVTFSQKQAESLGLDWQETYLAILNDLEVKNLRLVAYWDLLEPSQNNYSFSDLDWQMDEAEKYGAKVILVIGRRVPRWPECHQPSWLASLDQNQQRKAQLKYIEEIIKHYKNHLALKMWQVENEPFLELFGHCPPADKELLLKEISLVENLDPDHPVMVTDSGELATWLRTRNLSEYFGTTVYRVVYNPWIGYIDYGYFIPTSFYYLKGKSVGKPIDKIIVSEFQAEPWSPGGFTSVPQEEQAKSMDIERFRSNIDFAKRLGFSEVYFWGVEWWYWMQIKDNPDFWQEAKNIF